MLLVAIMMLAPLTLGAIDGQFRTVLAYALSAGITALVGSVCVLLGRNAPADLHRKDAIGIVTLSWVGLGILGALPFVLEGSIPDVPSAIFESVSGFTTTGATVVSDVDGLTRATNFWRCLSHWVGGMGIVVLFVAIFPQLGVGAKHLFKTEVAGPITEGLRPKIKQTALALWWVYAALTAVCGALLYLAGMDWFDATCHAFSTLGTGGFSTRGASVGHFQSATIDWIISAFMLIAGLNFGLYYGALRGRWRELYRNYEVRFYVLLNAVVIAIVFFGIRTTHPDILTALRYATFQVLAVTSTTGFMTEDFETYPHLARFALFLTMFIGGCAGSTAGGLKASRVYAATKLIGREIRSAVSPNSVIAIRLGSTAVSQSVLGGILVYIAAYFLLFAVSSLFMVGIGLEPLTGMSSVVACLSSIGPGLNDVGPTQNFAFIPGIGKLLLVLCMIAGRLEIFVLLALFHRETWRK